MDRRTILNRFTFLQEASETLRNHMASVGEFTTVTAGSLLYHEGGQCEQFALVGAGSIRVFKSKTNGPEFTLYRVQDGQACPVSMLAMILERPAMATAIVEVPTEAVIFPAAAFRSWTGSDRCMRKFAFESMAARLIEVLALADDLAFRRMDQRLAHLLLERFSKQRQSVRIATTHEELANDLGSVREVVSRLLKKLERHGAIAMSRGRIELLNEAYLRTMIE